LISDLEYLVLASAVRLGDDAYGASVMKEVAEATGKPCSVGASYTTLDRLEEKGLITTSMCDPTPVRAARPTRLIQVAGRCSHVALVLRTTVASGQVADTA
jgi:PadR family transcriptional regulator